MTDANGNLSTLGQAVADAVGRLLAQRSCHPVATYRVQLSRDTLGFRDAAAVAPYLDELGVSHLYASPCFKTRSGSTHGYSVVDFGQLDTALGSADDYRALVEALHGHGLGQILDVVSNHMSATPVENLWWNDVLENGPGSPYAAFFDVDWRPVKEELQDKVLLPMLGEQYGQMLELGELQLELQGGSFFVRYFQTLLPLEPKTYTVLLAHRLDELKATLPAESDAVRELESILTALEHLPDYKDTDPARMAERQREKEVVKDRLGRLCHRSAAVAEFIARNVQEFNGSREDPHSYDRLDKLLDAQVYRLAHWKAAGDEVNYRRFFDVNDLVAVCMEDPQVFQESHRLVFDLLVRGDVVDALRIDHIDGLYDPMEYLRRLQWGYVRALGRGLYQHQVLFPEHGEVRFPGSPPLPEGEGTSGDLWDSAPEWSQVEPAFLEAASAQGGDFSPAPATEAAAANDRAAGPNAPPPGAPEETPMERFAGVRLPLAVVVEKILGPEEPLPEHWPVAGTTGYDFLNHVNGLFVNPAGLAQLDKVYSRFTDQRLDFREVAYQSKQLILRATMASEVHLLAHRLNRISRRHRRSRDFTLNALRGALREILACFPVYRTYIHEGHVSERDRQFVCRAVAQAKRRNSTLDAAVFDFIRDVLLLQLPSPPDEADRREWQLFVGRFQQTTSPVMAKGIEDTAFYRYCPLLSLNEVGGDPARGPTTLEEFHRQNQARQARWPRSLLATSTHDVKRSEDTRTRINVLSEIPHRWRTALNRWARLNRRHRCEVDGLPAPSRNDEYLFYQSLVGVWPLAAAGDEPLEQLTARMQAYMEKATREAKIDTNWINPNPSYDAAVRQFIAAVLATGPKNRFLGEFRRFHQQVVNWGLYSALAQVLLKLTSPGVPDIYQGQEVWDFSLVDPDNRRPVDFAAHRELLAGLTREVGQGGESLLTLARQLALDPRDPRSKLLVTWLALRFRRRRADLFRHGDYIPLEARGARAKHVCAFARRSVGPPQVAIAVAPRLLAHLTPLAEGAALPPPPLGAAVWEDTRLVLGGLASMPLVNLFTGQVCVPEEGGLPLAAVLADFPVALLTNVP